jgi:hypothetical protein
MAGIHRVTIAPELYEVARRYMVDQGLPHVRAAVEAMIDAEDRHQQGEVQRTIKGGRLNGDPSQIRDQVPAETGPRRSNK